MCLPEYDLDPSETRMKVPATGAAGSKKIPLPMVLGVNARGGSGNLSLRRTKPRLMDSTNKGQYSVLETWM